MARQLQPTGDTTRSHHEDMQHGGGTQLALAAEQGHAATHRDSHALAPCDAKAEARLRCKIDLYVVPTVALLYLFCFVDRANIGNARLAGFEEDLKLKGNDYNAVLSVFYISYILFEIPSNMCCKWMGPGWFIPITTLGFGICSIGTAFVNDMAGVSFVRFLLGIFEAGMLPGIAYYMSRWYTRSELVFRLSLYIVMAPLAGAFGGLLASAILKLDNFGSTTRWRMIFAIEGLITVILSLISFFTLTDRPETARWLTPEEKKLAIERVRCERVGTTEMLDKIDWTKTIEGIICPTTLVTSFVFLLDNITVQGLAFFTPTIVRTIYPKDSVISQQLHTVPPYLVGAFFTVLFPFLSWRFDTRQLFMLLSAPLMMCGYMLFLASASSAVRYAATFIIASGAFPFGALVTAQVSANVISDTARASAIGMVVMMGNVGGLIATWSFLPSDKPHYRIGNGLNLATSSVIFVVSGLLLGWMKRDNGKRARKAGDEGLAGLTEKQVQDLDWRHPSFKWRP
ncbi:putative MFS transporter [Massariosphaeria phaeospora]|uniref:Putative MFS transporter n=1 Tax=Massariosphaeria phaeospora TaxID=100035 RepID=A0A7C8IE07_9PLEO|nr:putative MFS transporter [Massariosphaeria phaeospora]